jgi:Flp pilus assembly protein TadB
MRSLVASNRAIVSELVGSFGGTTSQSGTQSSSWLGSQSWIRFAQVVGMRELRNTILVAFMLAGAVAGLVSPLMGSVVLLLAGAMVWCKVKVRQHRRSNAIQRDLPALLTSVASSVRAGIDPLQAIIEAEEYFPADSPLRHEVRAFKLRLAAGEDESKVVEKFLEEDANRDAELFKQCLLLSRKHGSSLAEPLHRVVRVVRQRQSFKRKTQAALAMHRMSGFGIMLCAVLAAFLQFIMNPQGIKAAVADPRGVVLLSIGGSLIVLGVVWMMRMGREEVL